MTVNYCSGAGMMLDSHEQRESLGVVDRWCVLEKGGLTHVVYDPTLKVLAGYKIRYTSINEFEARWVSREMTDMSMKYKAMGI